MRTVVYYAHPISLYGTKQEQRDIDTLEALGFSVLNPNSAVHEAGYAEKGMQYFEELVSGCQALAFRAFPDGGIPAGIFKEVNAAKEKNIPVLELPSAMSRRSLSVDATREALREAGCR